MRAYLLTVTGTILFIAFFYAAVERVPLPPQGDRTVFVTP